MADMLKARIIRTLRGTAPRFVPYPVEGSTATLATSGSSSQIFAGDVLTWNDADRVQKADDGDLVFGVSGWQQELGSVAFAEDTLIPVSVFDAATIFEMQYSTTVTRALIGGTHKDHLVDASGDPVVNAAATTDNCYAVVDVDLTTGRTRVHVIGGSGVQYGAESGTKTTALA